MSIFVCQYYNREAILSGYRKPTQHAERTYGQGTSWGLELTARRMVAGLEDSTLLSEEDQLSYIAIVVPKTFLGKNFKDTIVIRHTSERA